MNNLQAPCHPPLPTRKTGNHQVPRLRFKGRKKMSMKHHRSPEAAALALTRRTLAKARRSAQAATDAQRTGQHRADIERAFIAMSRRGSMGRPIPSALAGRLPLLLMVDRGETLSSYQARMRACLGLAITRQPPALPSLLQFQSQLKRRPKASGG
jgi:hypothetical protein